MWEILGLCPAVILHTVYTDTLAPCVQGFIDPLTQKADFRPDSIRIGRSIARGYCDNVNHVMEP